MSDFEPPPHPTSDAAAPEAPALEATAPEARSGWRPRNVLVASVVGGLALFGIGFAVGSSTEETGDSSAESASTAGESDDDRQGSDEAEDSSPPTQGSVSVGPDDVVIDYVVLDEECFNTAGSLMEVELSPARAPASDLSVDDLNELHILVTYDITNTEGGVTRGSFVIEQGRYNSAVENLSFPRCNMSPDIVVTGVVER